MSGGWLPDDSIPDFVYYPSLHYFYCHVNCIQYKLLLFGNPRDWLFETE
jgi:hypothetical protein